MRYVWQTVKFEGATMDEATQAFDAWFGYGIEDFALTRQRIRRQADGSLHMYLSHWPKPKCFEIYVTALMQAEEVS